MSDPAKTIYKIFRKDEWEACRERDAFEGSPDDIRDGFIHFSTAEQLRETATKHFSDEENIVLAAVDAEALGEALKWEISRGGEKFPHLYAPLRLSAIEETALLSRDAEGRYIFPEPIP